MSAPEPLRQPAPTFDPKAAVHLMHIHGLEGLTEREVLEELKQGARFVVFDWCVSVVVLTFQRTSEPHFVRPHQVAFLHSLPYTLVTLLLGWWGIPWGPIHTISALGTNLRGGRDVTTDILNGAGGAPLPHAVPAPAA